MIKLPYLFLCFTLHLVIYLCFLHNIMPYIQYLNIAKTSFSDASFKHFHEADLPGFMSNQPVFCIGFPTKGAAVSILHLDGSPGPWASSQIFTGCPGSRRWGNWNFYLKRVNGGVDEKMMENI